MSTKSIKAIAIIAFLLSISCLTIGFTALSASLKINGVAKLKGNVFAVQFQNAVDTTTGGNGHLISGPLLSENSTNLSFSAELKKPGDEVSFTVEIKNNGQVDAALSKIELIGLDQANLAGINYTLAYIDDMPISTGDNLLVGSTKTLKVTIKYQNNAAPVLADQLFDLQINLTYTQK